MKNVAKEMQTKTVEVTVGVMFHCDICGATTEHDTHSGFEDEGNWSRSRPDVNFDIAVVACSRGYSCRDGGHKKTTMFDVCPKCFEEKIVPIFPSVPRTVENDW